MLASRRFSLRHKPRTIGLSTDTVPIGYMSLSYPPMSVSTVTVTDRNKHKHRLITDKRCLRVHAHDARYQCTHTTLGVSARTRRSVSVHAHDARCQCTHTTLGVSARTRRSVSVHAHDARCQCTHTTLGVSARTRRSVSVHAHDARCQCTHTTLGVSAQRSSHALVNKFRQSLFQYVACRISQNVGLSFRLVACVVGCAMERRFAVIVRCDT